MRVSWIIKIFVALFAYLLFIQGRALATGKMPELPGPLKNLFSATNELLRALDGVVASTGTNPNGHHPDLPDDIALEISMLRRSPMERLNLSLKERLSALKAHSSQQDAQQARQLNQPKKQDNDHNKENNSSNNWTDRIEDVVAWASGRKVEAQSAHVDGTLKGDQAVQALQNSIKIARSLRGAPPLQLPHPAAPARHPDQTGQRQP